MYLTSTPTCSTRVERTIGSTSIIWLSGEHDLACVESLRSALDAATNAVTVSQVIVDVSALTFVSAVTIGAISAAAAALQGRGATLIVRSPSPFVRKVFDICGLSALLAPASCRGHDVRRSVDPNRALVSV